MRRAEQIICLLWIAFATWVCLMSLGLELGTFSEPGPGLLPFGTGALIGLLALIHLAHMTSQHRLKEEASLAWINVNWRKGVYVVLALLVYVYLLPLLGYLINTFFLMLFLFTILERKKWWIVIIHSVLVIGLSYLIFGVWLKVQFPRGIWN